MREGGRLFRSFANVNIHAAAVFLLRNRMYALTKLVAALHHCFQVCDLSYSVSLLERSTFRIPAQPCIQRFCWCLR